MASLLELVQDCADRIGLPRPSGVIGQTDAQTRMLLQLIQQEGREQARRHTWQALTFQKTFPSLAQESQTDAIPDDFDRMVPETFWNRTNQWMVSGPLTAQEYADIVARSVQPVRQAFRIRGNAILMQPTPSAGETMAFEYVSKFWAGATGSTTPTLTGFSADSDIAYLDDELMRLGLVWRFKRARGLDYGEDFNAYERLLAQLSGRDGSRRILDMGKTQYTRVPRPPVAPDWSWNLS